MTHVLLIEDDPDIRSIVELSLVQVGGMTVTAVGDGLSGLEVLSDADPMPDVVLLDVMMPGMDGPQVLEMMRATPEGARLPVIFMTARVRPQELEEYRALGAAGLIAKPFDPMTLADEVRQLMVGVS